MLAELKGDDLSPADVRALAGALESTQRVCRLALGASTSNEIVVKPETPEIDLSKLDDQEFETFKRLMEKAGVPPIRGVKPPGGLQ